MKHIPVLLNEAVDAMNIRKGYSYIDGTAGQGGHAELIIKKMKEVNGRGSKVELILIDKDKEAIDELRKRFGVHDICSFHHGSFSQLTQYVSRASKLGGVLLDLGISSAQLDNPERGFSFQKGGPLDMRMNRVGVTAAEIVNESEVSVLVEILHRYGEERFARRIAEAIDRERRVVPIVSTTQLSEIVSKAIPKKFHGKTNPATKTFQALRIAVNDELKEVERGLMSALNALAPTGRLAVISFHSLEDRLVKQFMRANAAECSCPPLQPICSCGKSEYLKILTKKPIEPSEAEVTANPRSRSAKLRIAEKCLREAFRRNSERALKANQGVKGGIKNE